MTDEEIEKGMAAYRCFLRTLFDEVAANKDKIDVKRGARYDPYGTKGDRGTSSIKDCFPIIFELPMILLTLGFHGKLTPEKGLEIRGEDMLTVICPITEKYQSVIKMSDERKRELFGLLSRAGMRFDGADLSEEVDFSKIKVFTVTSEANAYLSVGLKLIAEAATNTKYYIKLENMLCPVILRGDFNPLANAVPKRYRLSILEYVNAQTKEIQEWIAKAHALMTGNGCVDVGSGVPFTYIKRNTSVSYGLVCSIEMGITGCFVSPGVNHLADDDSVTRLLPAHMADQMINCEGEFPPDQCFRRSGSMPFARFSFTYKGKKYEGCRHAGFRCQYAGIKCPFTGFSFDLSDPEVREMTMRWIEKELGLP